MSPGTQIAIYCALILLASLAGGWIPLWVRLTHTRLQVATSFVAGLMLGVGLLHLLPHAWHQLHSIDRTATWVLVGFMVMFFIQRFFQFHHHDVPAEAPETRPISQCDHAEQDHRGHAHSARTLAEKSAGNLSWAGAAVGLTLHTLIDGVALAASVQVEAQGNQAGILVGMGTFLVIIMHKPFDAMTIGTLMAAGGWSKTARHCVNALFALAIPAGIALFHLGASQASQQEQVFLGGALAFAAGTFLCIAASDLLPELQFHAHDRGKLSFALLAGVALSILVGRLEHHGHDTDHESRGTNPIKVDAPPMP